MLHCSRRIAPAAVLLLTVAARLFGGGPENVVVVANDGSALSRTIADYYVQKRGIPLRNVCHLRAPVREEISRDEYNRTVAAPIAKFLRSRGMVEKILYIVTTAG